MLRLTLLFHNSLIFASNSMTIMRLFLIVFISCLVMTSCDDGDIITIDLEFDDTFEACGDLVFYNIKSDPAQSLSVQITSPSLTLDDVTAVTITDNIAVLDNPTLERTINGTGNTFNYRSYNTTPDNFFCEDVPPSNIVITDDQESTTGTAIFTTTLIEDDNDGIPAEDEDLNGNGNLTDDDTDGDGIPNYCEADDVGDNVLTIKEDEDLDDDGNPFTNPLNTDSDSTINPDTIPNYLDNDDDGDGVLTRDEENDLVDQDPTNDRTDIDNPNLPDYLNPIIDSTVPANAYRVHQISQTFSIALVINGIQLPTLTQDIFEFGTLDDTDTTMSLRTVTPDFN